MRDEAHVTLLAADLIGYRNLTALISKGFLEGYYYKPRIDLDLLAQAQRRPDRALRLHVGAGRGAAAARTTTRPR